MLQERHTITDRVAASVTAPLRDTTGQIQKNLAIFYGVTIIFAVPILTSFLWILINFFLLVPVMFVIGETGLITGLGISIVIAAPIVAFAYVGDRLKADEDVMYRCLMTSVFVQMGIFIGITLGFF